MSEDAIYRYFGKNPSYEGGDGTMTKSKTKSKTKSGGTITVMPCGVITFSGSFTPAFADFVGYVGSHNSELADELAALEYDSSGDSMDDSDTQITDIVNSGVIVIGANDDAISEPIKLAPRMDEIVAGIHEAIQQSEDISADNVVDDVNTTAANAYAPFDITTI